MTPQEACEQFRFEGTIISCDRYGHGHINDTYLVTCDKADGSRIRYILQRVHVSIFKDPDGLMGNVQRVTAYLAEKIREGGGDPMRETMNLIPTVSDGHFIRETDGDIWRAYAFIENATCFDRVEKAADFYQSAYAFGRFQYLLADFDAASLTETIKDFHNTPVRFANFKAAVEADSAGRAASIADEIAFCMEREADMHIMTGLLKDGKLPLRVTHNDTKLNNVMIDDATGKGLCVIDLDTVMPGLAGNDFGDSIRFGANTAAEDETDLSKVSLSLDLFETYAKGFLAGCDGRLTETELKTLPMGAKLMTLECGMRFLTDHLEGDVYFKTHRPGHNLDRARCQFALVRDMEQKMPEMERIIATIAADT
ncbi:MAG: aminoglycoside phosphotransferase family protein [Lachnospiraceae bacterium]|nr:aminoglycoside phosphotransferase family protein [Lachnospiraceae bacterium]